MLILTACGSTFVEAKRYGQRNVGASFEERLGPEEGYVDAKLPIRLKPARLRETTAVVMATCPLSSTVPSLYSKPARNWSPM